MKKLKILTESQKFLLDNGIIGKWKLRIENSMRSRAGFTLIELLVVIAVIGALSSIVIVTFPAAQKRARDSQRKSDIKQYQTALESYANKNDGLYPGDDGDLTVNCGDFGLSGGACVDDPLATNPYQIQSSTTDYVIWAQLEMPNSSSQTVYFVSCSTGVSGDDTSVPTDENCPL